MFNMNTFRHVQYRHITCEHFRTCSNRFKHVQTFKRDHREHVQICSMWTRASCIHSYQITKYPDSSGLLVWRQCCKAKWRLPIKIHVCIPTFLRVKEYGKDSWNLIENGNLPSLTESQLLREPNCLYIFIHANDCPWGTLLIINLITKFKGVWLGASTMLNNY